MFHILYYLQLDPCFVWLGCILLQSLQVRTFQSVGQRLRSMSIEHMLEIICCLVGSVTTLFTFLITSCVVLFCMETLCVFVNFFLLLFLFALKLFLRLVSLAYASLSSKSKRFGIIFLCDLVMNLAAGQHSSSLVFGSLVSTATGNNWKCPILLCFSCQV